MTCPALSLPVGWRYERIPVNATYLAAAYPEHLQVRDKRAVLVLLHGFTGSALSWGSLLEELALPDMPVIALDLLGHGLADAPPDPACYGMEQCQRDLLALLHTLGVASGQAILLGYSMGGRIALYCAFSGYFRALILESASPGLRTSAERAQRRASDEALAERIEREGVAAFVDYWEQLPLFASQRVLPEAARLAQRARRLNNRAQGLANSLRGVGTGVQPALHARLPQLHQPVLLLTGALDQKFCAIAYEMAEQLPYAQHQIIPDAGHTVHLEQPVQFARSVRTFCSEGIQGKPTLGVLQ